MPARSTEDIRVGVVAFVAIVAIVLGIVWGKGCGFGIENHRYQVSLPDAAGVDAGTIVSIRGVRVGSVVAVTVDRKHVLLTVIISSSIRMYDDATATVRMLELTGGKALEVDPGVSKRQLADGGTIPGRVEDLGALLSSTAALGDDAARLVRRVDTVVAALSDMLINRGAKGEIEAAVGDLATASRDVRDLLQQNRPQIQSAIQDLAALSSDLRSLVREIRPSIDRTLSTVDTLGAEAKATSRQLRGTLRGADSLILHIDRVVEDLRNGKGAASRLLFDRKTADELQATIEAVRSLLQDIERNGIKAKVDVDIF